MQPNIRTRVSLRLRELKLRDTVELGRAQQMQ